MMRFFLLLVFIPAALFGTMTWEKSEEDFSAVVTIKPKSLSVLDTLTVEIKLIYPKGYKPNLDGIRANLVNYSGFTESPFTIFSEKIRSEAGKTEVIFTLNPQFGGLHAITPRDIHFLSENETAEKVFVSDIFNVTVTVPEENLFYEGEIASLSSLNTPEPIEISQANVNEWVDNQKNIQDSTNQIIYLSRGRTKVFETLFYGFIFVLIVGFTILLTTFNPKKTKLQPQRKSEKRHLPIKPWDKSQPQDQYLVKMAEMLRSHKLDEAKKESYYSLLQQAERVKFAQYTPTEGECQEAYRLAQKLLT